MMGRSKLRIVFCAAAVVCGIVNAFAQDGAITGTVTADTSGDPIPYVQIYVYDGGGGFQGSAQSEADGTYIVSDLAPGDYALQAQADGTPYMDEWYDDVHTSDYGVPGDATWVTVTAGQTTAPR